jgi:epoxyqueuosine reductase
MDTETLSREAIVAYAKEIGVSLIAFIKPFAFTEYLAELQQRPEYKCLKYHPYDKLLDAARKKQEYNTLIVLLYDYFVDNDYAAGEFKISNRGRTQWQTSDKRTATFRDYMRGHGAVADDLSSTTPCKAAACVAGLGFIGKNTLFYSTEFGSYVNIRVVGTDLALETVEHGVEKAGHPLCSSCRKCVEACPVQAIYPQGYRIHPFKCVSFVNRHFGEYFKHYPQDPAQLDDWLDGCEICQNVCPHNQNKKHPGNVEIEPLHILGMTFDNKPSVSLAEILEKRRDIENREYRVFVDMLIGGRNIVSE